MSKTVERFPSAFRPFGGHPFKVLNGNSMTETVEIVRQLG